MNKKGNNNEELQSRREFFKKAAKGALPFLGVAAFGPALLSSCGGSGDDERDEPQPNTNGNNSQSGTSGDGTLNNPFTPAAAIAYAKSLGADVISPYEVYIKGSVSEILANYGTVYGNYGGVASFYLEGNNGERFIALDLLYFNKSKYSSGSLLQIGDTVIICGKIVNYYGSQVGTLSEEGYLYSLNDDVKPNNSCSDCTSVCSSTCTNSCTSGCTGSCGNSCSGGCTSSCSSACTGTCTGYCTGGCTGGCSTSCTGECSTSCTGGCGSTCSSTCSGTCSGYCTGSCTGGCSTGCTGCTGGCSTGCTGGCSSYCTGTCKGGCDLSCSSLCTTTCRGGCDTSCLSGCLYTCRGGCKGTSYRYGY